MKFIDIILQNSQAKEAKLVGPATKASTNPETGVTIVTPVSGLVDAFEAGPKSLASLAWLF